ncbi:hypothetical protein R3O67_30600 [Bacillus cereus]|uniref:hypothetical protein n=1 Tax=Bacillus cereus TaxID=1396 RepID=UPI00307A1751
MKRRKNFKLPKEIKLQVTQVKHYISQDVVHVDIYFRLENYEDDFCFEITKEPKEQSSFKIMIQRRLKPPALKEIYSDNSLKKFRKYMEEERIEEFKEKILESIEANDEFAEHKLELLLLLSL